MIELWTKRYLSSKFKKLWTTVLVMIFLQMITPMNSNATLLAVGERDSESYRIGYAIASILTLKSQEQTVYFDVIPSNDGDDEITLLQNRVSDFALVDSASAVAAYKSGDIAKAIRGLAFVRHPHDRMHVLLTRADVAEQDVVEVIKAIFDNLDLLVQLHESASGIEAYNELEEHPFSIHPGAASYFADVDQKPIVTTTAPDNGEGAEEASSVIADLSAQLELIKLEREALTDEVESGRVQQLSIIDKLKSVEQQLETVTGERKRFFNELVAAKRQIDSIEFQELFEANEAARAMQLKAEESDVRYQEAFGVAQTCLETQTGRKDNAVEALVQIERLESEVAACRAGQNSKGD